MYSNYQLCKALAGVGAKGTPAGRKSVTGSSIPALNVDEDMSVSEGEGDDDDMDLDGSEGDTKLTVCLRSSCALAECERCLLG